MDAPHSPDEARAATALTDAVARWDECVILLDEAGAGLTKVLDQAERELLGHGIRSVRVSGLPSGELALPELMARLMGRTDPDALPDGGLDAGLATPIEPGGDHDRVALLIDEAHAFLPPALRCVQLACQTGPGLRVVLAGRHGLAAALAGDEFTDLRRRITRTLTLPGPTTNRRPTPLFAMPPPTPALPARRRAWPWALAGLGMAASLAFVAWTTLRGGAPAPTVTATNENRRSMARAEPEAPLVAWIPRRDDAPVPPGTTGPAELAPPAAADPASPEQEQTQAPTMPPPSERGPPLAPEPAARIAATPLPDQPPPPAARHAAPAVAAPETPGPDVPGPDVPEDSRVSPPGTAVVTVEPRPSAAQDSPEAPVRAAEPAAARAPEQAVVASLPVPPSPSQPLSPPAAAISRPADAQGTMRRARGNAERVAAAPASNSNERRCRVILLRVQVGEDLVDADRQFLHSGCRIR